MAGSGRLWQAVAGRECGRNWQVASGRQWQVVVGRGSGR